METRWPGITEAGSSQQHSDSEKSMVSEEDHQKRILLLWVSLMEGWGHKFISSAGDEPNGTWTDSLSDLSNRQFKLGMDFLSASTGDWPPSVGEFRRWCLDVLDPKEARQAAIAAWDSKPAAKYNPFNAGMTYAQQDRARQTFIESHVAEATMHEVNERRRLNHQEPITDPRRICRDEEYM